MVKVVMWVLLALAVVPVCGLSKCCPQGQGLDLHTKLCQALGPMEASLSLLQLTVNAVVDLETGDLDTSSLALSSLAPSSLPSCSPASQFLVPVSSTSLYTFQQEGVQMEQLLDDHSSSWHTHFCVDSAREEELSSHGLLVARVCGCQGGGSCTNYCCPPGQVLGEGGCKGELEKGEVGRVSFSLQCPQPLEYPPSLWSLQGGNMTVDSLYRQPSEYCLAGQEGRQRLLLCPSLEPGGLAPALALVKKIFLTVSILSLLLLITIHLSSSYLRRQRISGLKLPLYCSLLLSFLSLVTTQSLDFSQWPLACLAWASLLQFSGLSVFCWLSAISLDIWLTFSKLRSPTTQRAEHKKRVQQMRVLQVLAFTVPAAATLATLLAQLLLSPKSGATFHPNIGATSSCFLGQHLPQLLYFQAPVLLLLLSNTCFYCRVIYQLTAGIFTCDGESFRNIRISLEFLFVMGINWIAEGATFLVSWLAAPYRHHPLLLLLQALNQLSGLLLLLVFLGRQQNRQLLLGSWEADRVTTVNTPLTSRQHKLRLGDLVLAKPDSKDSTGNT